MSAELRQLYQDVILDHSRRPRNCRALDRGARRAQGDNPLCGDTLTVYIHVVDGALKEVTFHGTGCAIAMASASMMTEALQGRSRAEADALFRDFQALLTSDRGLAADGAALGPLAVFAGVRGFPSRVKCATLAWHTLQAALDGEPELVSPEL